MGNQITTTDVTKKKRSIRAADLSDRVTALENSNTANHSEMMRMLLDINIAMKAGFTDLSKEVRDQAIQQVTQNSEIAFTQKEVQRIDSKLNRIIGAIGTLALTAVGGIFTVVARYITKV